ncbi:sigma-54-dependent transcriptional regulator [Flavivirga rizhaonensis]|uniref:Sigma-54-dependent Fis family transcriptional regulator n=1 Tax=Flavivirga rizhaonensis TaxID=2559571 RepID=A0A4S1E3Y8_9FLAO|nr:sigma-54 dependent transcriptional regulator [Flavivirga rizhaonensis]TGV04702.1 sigma-54-dependent Fis family transcriptional regulator [Flavivirga rizhaonensis]
MILIVDDDVAVRTSLLFFLKQEGFLANAVASPKEALQEINKEHPELVLLDMNFSIDTSGKDGLSLLKKIKKISNQITVILISGWGSVPLAVEGIKLGAYDFVTKPWDNKTLLNTIKSSIGSSKVKKTKTNKLKREDLDKTYNFENIIGKSQGFLSILETVGNISKTDAPVLILGESGTGKEVIAEAIHKNSLRLNQAFVKVNMGGIPETLFESEMFGHKRGAFTDAKYDRVGRFELANKGSIFLDEIGDLSLNSQVKLLRVLQDKTYAVVGDSRTKKSDVRVICATNRDLEDMLSKNLFREDLFYRLNLITIYLPPLRERTEDVPELTTYFLNKTKEVYGFNSIEISDNALKWLSKLKFYGNIRELKNLIERTALIYKKGILEIEHFKNQLQNNITKTDKTKLPTPGKMSMDEIEKNMIIKTLEHFNHNISKVANALGLSRGALYRRLEKYDIRVLKN